MVGTCHQYYVMHILSITIHLISSDNFANLTKWRHLHQPIATTEIRYQLWNVLSQYNSHFK